MIKSTFHKPKNKYFDNDINLTYKIPIDNEYYILYRLNFFLNSESYENCYKRIKRMGTAEHRNLKVHAWRDRAMKSNGERTPSLNDCTCNLHLFTMFYLGGWLCVEVGSKTPTAL